MSSNRLPEGKKWSLQWETKKLHEIGTHQDVTMIHVATHKVTMFQFHHPGWDCDCDFDLDINFHSDIESDVHSDSGF